MSAGQHILAADDLNNVPAVDDAFYARVKLLVDACRRDRDHTIPWLANRTVDCAVVYIDSSVPIFLPITLLDTGETLPYHEIGECLGMNEGLQYGGADGAHVTLGNACEKRRVEELGGDWIVYQNEMAGYIRGVDHEAMTNVPADIDRRVFTEGGDQAAIEAIITDNKRAVDMTVRKFTQGAVVADGTLGERQIRVIASDPAVDRVKDVMVPDGCVLTNYRLNPIVLANHDATQPIGNATIAVVNGRVEAVIDFAPKGISAKADEYCALYKAGVLRAVSVGFDPIEAEPIKGTGGIRYNKWELMELSCVSVPAQPNAITIARSADIALAPQSEWKVGASLNLPIDAEGSWNVDAAAESIFQKCGFDTDTVDVTFARKGFLFYDAANPKRKDSYRYPFAHVKDGRLCASVPALFALAAYGANTVALAYPEAARQKAISAIQHYEAKMTQQGIAPARSKQGKPSFKGLYDCAELAAVLAHLGWIHDSAVWEQEIEQDASKLPAMLAGVMQAAAAALLAMTEEEVAELLAQHIEPIELDADYVAAGATPAIKNLRAAFRKAGRTLSASNLAHATAIQKSLGHMAKCFEKAAALHDDLHDQLVVWADHGTSAGEHAKALVDANGQPEQDPDPDSADNELAAAAAVRKREVDAFAARHPVALAA